MLTANFSPTVLQDECTELTKFRKDMWQWLMHDHFGVGFIWTAAIRDKGDKSNGSKIESKQRLSDPSKIWEGDQSSAKLLTHTFGGWVSKVRSLKVKEDSTVAKYQAYDHHQEAQQTIKSKWFQSNKSNATNLDRNISWISILATNPLFCSQWWIWSCSVWINIFLKHFRLNYTTNVYKQC